MRIKDNIRKSTAATAAGAANGAARGQRGAPCWLGCHGWRVPPRTWSRRDGCRRCGSTLLVLVPALVAVVALLFYLLSGRYVSTDNAYIGAQKVLITPEVSGKVVRIAVAEGQLLKPGDELLAIDPEPYRLAAQEAEAQARCASRATSPL